MRVLSVGQRQARHGPSPVASPAAPGELTEIGDGRQLVNAPQGALVPNSIIPQE